MASKATCDEVSRVVAHGVQQVNDLISSENVGKTEFAKALLSLLEVTGQLAELDDNSQLASAIPNNESNEACTWREMSSQTLQFAKATLLGQQLHALEVLQDLSLRGGSLVCEPDDKNLEEKIDATNKSACLESRKVDVDDLSTSCGESSGSDGEESSKSWVSRIITKSLPAPPGLSAPPGLCAPPPGLSAPSGPEKTSASGEAKKAAPWRSSTVVAKQAAKKVAPWKSQKIATASVDKTVVGAFQ